MQHYEEKHDWKMLELSSGCILQHFNNENLTSPNKHWHPGILTFDDQIFLSRFQRNPADKLFHAWIHILGPPSKAEKYEVSITLGKENEDSHMTLKTRVFPIDSERAQVWDHEDSLGFTQKQIKKCLTANNNEEMKKDYPQVLQMKWKLSKK